MQQLLSNAEYVVGALRGQIPMANKNDVHFNSGLKQGNPFLAVGKLHDFCTIVVVEMA
jgi:hypothetical protein